MLAGLEVTVINQLSFTDEFLPALDVRHLLCVRNTLALQQLGAVELYPVRVCKHMQHQKSKGGLLLHTVQRCEIHLDNGWVIVSDLGGRGAKGSRIVGITTLRRLELQH